MSTPADNCKHCQKSGLSLLLLRPSPVATLSTLQPPGASVAVADGALVNPLIPAGLTESRPALRLLRAGYVHLYIPSKNLWRTWRVTDNADLLEQNHPLFGAPSVSATCTRSGHNASGFKLMHIPMAHELMGQSIWLAFSANVWNDKIKARNQANRAAMVEIKLGGVAAPAFKPEAQAIKRQLLEGQVLNWRLPKLKADVQPPFAFTSLAKEGLVEHLAQTLKDAAARHPKTAGHELAVVLPDPVGYAAELNALRLARFEMAKQDAAKPENAHPLLSLQMLDGLRQSVIDEQEARSFEVISPVMHRGAFETIMRVKPNPRGWPEGTRWEPMTDRQDLARHGPGMGRVVFPDQEERRRAWAADATERNWQRYRQFVDEGKLQSWKDDFDKKMLAAHGKPLERAENDWWTACQHAGLAQCLALHFDDKSPNRPGTAQDHCSGTAYATEVRLAMTPQPLQRGTTFERYLAELNKTPTDKTAYLQRALAGNQSEVLAALQEYVMGAQGPKDAQGNATYQANQEESTRSDKLHDLAAGLLQRADANTVLGRHHIKFSWMLHAAYGVNTVAIAQSLTAAGAAALGVVGGKGPKGAALVRRLEALLTGTQQMMLARESAAKGTVLQVPVRVKLRVPVAEAEQARRALSDAGHTPSRTEEQLRRAAQKGMVQVDVVTTNLHLREFEGDIRAALAAGKADIALGAAVGSAAGGAPVITLTRAQYAKFMTHQTNLAEKAALAMRELVQGVKGGGLSLDGHIGLVALLLNGLSAWKSAEDTFKSGGDLEKWFAFADSAAGTFGGLAQVAHSAMSMAIASRAGQAAVEKSLWVLGANFASSGLGAFGGMATAAGQFVKAGKAGNKAIGQLYFWSGASFFGQFTVNGVQFIGAFSEFMIARGSKRAVWGIGLQAAKSAGTRLVAATGIGLTGWGLIFLAGGLIFEIGVVMLTPDALQKHVQKSFFGNGKDKYETAADEEKAIRDMTDPLRPTPEPDVVGNMEIDPMLVAP